MKSGLPLEYEVFDYLEKKGCQSRFEYSYLKLNENAVETEFSFDIDAAYIKGENHEHYFNLMIECKYRDESTNWLFLPYSYDSYDLRHTCFLHELDVFNKELKYPYINPEMPQIGKACTKGIEIASTGHNPKSITQAVNQLNYAMASNILSSLDNQYTVALANDTIFYHIPIIVTTANIYRMEEGTCIADIKNSSSIEDFSTKEDCIVLNITAGKDLENHNREVLFSLLDSYDAEELKSKMNFHTDDIGFFLSVIAKHKCPSSIIVIQHTKDNSGLNKLFELLDNIISPSKATLEYLKARQEELDKIDKELDWLLADDSNVDQD